MHSPPSLSLSLPNHHIMMITLSKNTQSFSTPRSNSFPFSKRIEMAASTNSSISELNQSLDRESLESDPHTSKLLQCSQSSFSDLVSRVPTSLTHQKLLLPRSIEKDDTWSKMVEEAKVDIQQEPILSDYYHHSILSHKSLESALASHLASNLSSTTLPSTNLFDLFLRLLSDDGEIIGAVKQDLKAVRERDPACVSHVHCFLNFKGFLACQAYRVAHKLWSQGRKILALLIQNRVSQVFAVDIHPGARIGCGILLDHATGVVIGETAVIGDNVSILHNVTLGGTGKEFGDRHPKIGDGVLIGAGTCVLGNIKIGDGAKIGAGSVVLKDVQQRTTAVGNPARLVGVKQPSFTMLHASYAYEWSDYVI